MLQSLWVCLDTTNCDKTALSLAERGTGPENPSLHEGCGFQDLNSANAWFKETSVLITPDNC